MNPDINFISDGQGTPLVFQHGLTANVTQTEALLKELNGVRLLSIDCPGHGKTPLMKGYQPSFNQYTDEVIDFIDSQQVSRAFFGGISMGSGIAVNLALRYPGYVKGLILVRPAWLDWPDPENLQILKPAADLMKNLDGREKFSDTPGFKAVVPPAAAQSILGVFAEDQQPELAGVIEAMVQDRPFNSTEQLSEISVPCVVIANHDDPLHPYEMAEKIHESIPGSVLRKVTSRYIDDQLHTQQVRQIIQKFIEENNSINEK